MGDGTCQSTSNQHSRSPEGQTSYLPATLLAPSPSRASTAARSVNCRAAIANREKQKARPRYAGERAAACVSPQSGQTLRERCTARFSTSRSRERFGDQGKGARSLEVLRDEARHLQHVNPGFATVPTSHPKKQRTLMTPRASLTVRNGHAEVPPLRQPRRIVTAMNSGVLNPKT